MDIVKKNKWFIAYKKRGEDLFDLSDLTIIEPPVDTYIADPFIIAHNGRTYIFYEWYDYIKGRLAVSELIHGKLTPPRVILERSWHLSFPSVTQIDGEFYMTPEEVMSGKLRIYKAVKFPYEWEELTIVAEGRYADPILFKDGNYCIYATEADNVRKTFRSDSIEGPWRQVDSTEHIHSRAAGHLFDYQGTRLRPTQECFPRYGRSLHFYDNTKLVKSIEPDWMEGLTGTHTFNFTDDYVVIDGRIPLI